MARLLFTLLLLVFALYAKPPVVLHILIEGAISPASSSHLGSAIEEAEKRHAQLLVVSLDTPGGLVSSMREMIRSITNSPVPVAVYVAPKGAHAASAGTYLTYAAHIAAMAPGTNIGAATPISMGSPGGSNENNASGLSTAMAKARNDARATLKSLAQLRERNATWALNAVDRSESLAAEDALRMGVVDYIAYDLSDLMQQLEGKSVRVNNTTLTLQTAKAEVQFFKADWKSEMLGIITEPNIAYMLLLIAIYGIFFEMMNPGSVFPGVAGAIAGVLALYALNLIPFNYAGLLLILLGIAFMVAEVFVAGFGVLGIGGVVAFAAGSLLLFDAQTLGSDISLPLILAFSLVSGGFFIYIFGFVWRIRHQKALGGHDEMVGAEAEVLETTQDGYRVRCHGEIWSARSETPLQKGERVRVAEIDGLVLNIQPLTASQNDLNPTRS